MHKLTNEESFKSRLLESIDKLQNFQWENMANKLVNVNPGFLLWGSKYILLLVPEICPKGLHHIARTSFFLVDLFCQIFLGLAPGAHPLLTLHNLTWNNNRPMHDCSPYPSKIKKYLWQYRYVKIQREQQERKVFNVEIVSHSIQEFLSIPIKSDWYEFIACVSFIAQGTSVLSKHIKIWNNY